MLDRVMGFLTRRMNKLSARLDDRTPVVPMERPSAALADGLRSQGNALLEQGQLAQAQACFEEGLQHAPENLDLLICMGFVLKEQGQWELAQRYLQRAYQHAQGTGPAWEIAYLLGQIHEALGQPDAAQLQYALVTRLRPQFASACADLLRLYRQYGRSSEVASVLRRLIQAAPDVPDYREWLGVHYLEKGQHTEALGQFDAQLVLQPDLPPALCNRGLALYELKQLDAALEAYTRALERDPNLVLGYSNRAGVYKRMGRMDQAIADLQRSIALSPGASIPHNNLGEVYRDQGNLDLAQQHLDIAIQLEPQDPVAYWNKGNMLLQWGRLDEGFPLYEYRWSMHNTPRPQLPGTAWLGDFDIDGKTIVVYSEQGLGDTIQFARYVPMLSAKGAKVIFQVQAALVSLFRGMPGMGKVVERGTLVAVADCHCALMSLPLAFRTGLHSIPSQPVNLCADEDRVQVWTARLGPGTRPRVGLVWSGNAAHQSDHLRSLPLAQLVTCLPQEWEWVSLQKEVRPTDEGTLQSLPRLRHFGADLGDFKDTAALCSLLDVVVCVDTSVAHLSASLGRPTWVLLHELSDWRWMLGRQDSPWYPSMRLFRREHGGSWDAPLAAVAQGLTGFVL